MNEGLNTLLEMLQHPEFCKSFANDPMGTLTSRQIEGVPYSFVNVLAELSYDELRLLGNVGSELHTAVGGNGGLLF